MENFETDLDVLNRTYRYCIVNIFTTPIMLGDLKISAIPLLSTGIFLEANESGIWLLSTRSDRYNKKDFFYHDKIVKIEEVEKAPLEYFKPEQKDEIEKCINKYENKRRQEIEEFNKSIVKAPDVPDPNDHKKIATMLDKVQSMVLSKKQEEKENFLEKRN